MVAHVAPLWVDENVPLVFADFEDVRPQFPLANFRKVFDLPSEFPIQITGSHPVVVLLRKRGRGLEVVVAISALRTSVRVPPLVAIVVKRCRQDSVDVAVVGTTLVTTRVVVLLTTRVVGAGLLARLSFAFRVHRRRPASTPLVIRVLCRLHAASLSSLFFFFSLSLSLSLSLSRARLSLLSYSMPKDKRE